MPEQPTAVICDDDPVMRALATRLLEREHFAIIAELDSAYAAVQVAKVSKPDLIVLDLVLPDFSGEHALPSILQAAPDCTVVIWSGFDSSVDFEASGVIVAQKAGDDLARTLAALRAGTRAVAATRQDTRLAHLARRAQRHTPIRRYRAG
jgi:DNA-binding NarL/FixJ family response regulator